MGSERFPVEVRAVGLLKHRKEKAFMLSVSWSDQINVLIYRTPEEFKKLHKELKSKFPIQSGLLKKSDRTIPKFRDANLKLQKTRNLSRCMEGLKMLETYCQELLKAGAKISQGEDVVGFFEARSCDLDPSFPEDSVVILPSAAGDRKAEAATPSSPVITQPVISQSYWCIEDFETKDVKSRPFRACKEERLEVLMKDRTGWWLVENDGKQIAWFPAPYLEEPAEVADGRESGEEGRLYYVTRAYKARKLDELSVSTGVVVEALEESDNGWWLVRYNGTAGYVPSMFLQPYRNPHSRFLTLAHRGLCSSTPNLSAGQKSSSTGASSTHSAEDPLEGQGPRWRQVRSQSLSRDLGLASSGLTTGTDSSTHSAGDLSEESQQPKSKGVGNGSPVENFQHASGSPDSPLANKPRSDSGFEEPLGYPESLLSSSSESEPTPGGPRVPPRPSTQEILQRCTTITKRTVQGACPRSCSRNWP